MKIVRMNEANISAVKQIEDECFSNPWSFESLNAELSKVGACFYVAELNGEAAGYIGFNMVLDEGYIANIAVKEKFRRQGVGRKLLQKVIETAVKNNLSFVSLEVRESNISAIGLYKEFGFTQQGIRKNFYRNPQENGLILTKFFIQ
ncbi:MAG: ribosomal protein S18-alanine N-acetyltransferase [Oscillospiraceae bacterium]|nr:ribosomal protein S18-alanine N-acetyltransferase [Oscillospiraceae bacterium]